MLYHCDTNVNTGLVLGKACLHACSSATPKSVSAEAHLKAATSCMKNFSNTDNNNAALLDSDGLVKALAHAVVVTCSEGVGALRCTTNACQTLTNLSISKANKHKVFKTDGVMGALMTVLARTKPRNNRSGGKFKPVKLNNTCIQ